VDLVETDEAHAQTIRCGKRPATIRVTLWGGRRPLLANVAQRVQGGLMAKKAKKARKKSGAAGRSRSKKLSIKKESVRDRASAEPRTPRGAIVINTKALRGMVIERSAASLFKRGG